MDHPTLTAALIAITIGSMKIIEHLVEWMTKKFTAKNEKTEATNFVVKFDEHVTRMFIEDHEHINTIYNTVSVRDGSGVPLIYTPRSMLDEQKQMSLLLGQISNTQSRIVEMQDRLSESQDKVAVAMDNLLKEIREERHILEDLSIKAQ